jgi:aminoglycoside 6'-N-acetyltransferase I
MIERAVSLPHNTWLALRMALWPHGPRDEHLAEMEKFIAHPNQFGQFIAYSPSMRPIGLAEASLRFDYVNGTSSSPVAFLEGLYVVPDAREQGVAQQLVEAVTDWARTRDCTELASDALLDNQISHAVHLALGFQESERVIFFKKSINDNF